MANEAGPGTNAGAGEAVEGAGEVGRNGSAGSVAVEAADGAGTAGKDERAASLLRAASNSCTDGRNMTGGGAGRD